VNVASEPASLRGRDLLSIADLERDEVLRIFDLASELKREYLADRRHANPPLVGRTLAMLFQKPSLRTRVTFEAGMNQLGGHAVYLTEDTIMGARETVHDVARNLERFVDAIVARTGPHAVVAELAAQADIPVINGLTLREHPCQALADMFTMGERFGRLEGLVVAFVGDGNNVYHSLALLGAMLGMEVRLAHPAGYAPNQQIVERARRSRPSTVAASSSRRSRPSPSTAPRSSTPTPGRRWARKPRPSSAATPSPATGSTPPCSMAAGPDAVAMHCLPAHRGEEITSDVMDGPRSIIWDQSENRLHVQKALLVEVIGG
jgi:ornithine carbamoyltransferase